MVAIDYKNCKPDDIINWCIDNKKVEWLKQADKDYPNFFTLRKVFFETFMPDAIPTAKPKKPTYHDKIKAL